MRPILFGLTIAIFLTCPAAACTIMTLVVGDQVWMGNNEDFTKRGAVWFVPASDGKFGRVNFGFHSWTGKRENFAQGSMNEKGLAFDAAVTPKVDWSPDTDKPTPNNLIELIMDQCVTLDQAVQMFRDNNCHHLAGSQFMFADATGASAVVAWDAETGLSIKNRSGNHHVVANTQLATMTYRCARWTKATEVLAADPEPSFDTVRRALDAVHQHGKGFTSYSCIYELTGKRVSIYNLSNFDEVVTFDLADELNKGESSHLLKNLFKNSPALNEITSKPQRVDFDTGIKIDSVRLGRFGGLYQTETAPKLSVRVESTADGLRVINPGQSEAALFPESETRFRIAPDRGQVSFQTNEHNEVIALTLHKQVDVVAKRISD